MVTRRVIDHAYEPTREVLIRTDSDTTKAFTTPDGHFRGEFENFQSHELTLLMSFHQGTE